ncbi:MAG: TolC family protein, partial [Candidatus Sulfotelmatobacter sp.]
MRLRSFIAGTTVALSALSLCAQNPPKLPPAPAAEIWTWDQVKDRFELNNTSLMAAKLNIDELKAEEITAHLRPNPDFTFTADGTQISPSHGVWQPFAGTFVSPGISYLFERRNK